VDQPALAGIRPVNRGWGRPPLDSTPNGRYRGESSRVLVGRVVHVKQNQLKINKGAHGVIVVALGGYIYHERTKPEGVQIQFDQNGLKIQKN
jgi:hypothetical protein